MTKGEKIFLGIFFSIFIVAGVALIVRAVAWAIAAQGLAKTTIILLIAGVAFTLAGAGFLYCCVIRKHSVFDMAAEYQATMVDPADTTDADAHTEAVADQLSKAPQSSGKRMFGELGVWWHRLGARFKTFTVGEHLFCLGVLLLPVIVLNVVYPLWIGRRPPLGWLRANILVGLVIGLLLLVLLKVLYLARWQWLVKRGKFTERRQAVVVCSAFESAHQMGSRVRPHIISKKFRVIATIDGVRGVGYVKGHVPPAPGTVLAVRIRPGHPKQWILDTEQ